MELDRWEWFLLFFKSIMEYKWTNINPAEDPRHS